MSYTVYRYSIFASFCFAKFGLYFVFILPFATQNISQVNQPPSPAVMLILTEPEEDRVQAVHGGHGQVHVAPAQHLDYLLTAAALPKGWRL